VIDVALLDYGTGNLHSLAKALEAGGARVRTESEPHRALEADLLVLPGVGAFTAAATQIASGNGELRRAVAAGKPCLGICLGMQLLFDSSEEGAGQGLGLFSGRVRRLRARRVPHMGWNAVLGGDDPVFDDLDEPLVYYANSYVVEPESDGEVIAWTEYDGERFPAAVRRGATLGLQFHPEKSGEAGLRLLKNYIAEVAR
jgi:imidazole glycerol-phosphate synthase subunit HisH